MKIVPAFCLLLFANLRASSRVTASVIHEGDAKGFRIHRRNAYDSSNDTALHISGLRATVHGGNRATVQWENATGHVAGYEITVCSVSEQPQCESGQVQKPTVKLQRLTAGATYEVAVRAYTEEDGDRTDGKTEKIHFTTAEVPVVEDLQVIRVKSTSIELSWAPPNGSVSHFDINACPADGGACVHAYTENLSHVLGGLTPETTYYIRVRSATEEDKELSFGEASNISATTKELPALHDISLRATCDSFIIASWNSTVEGITGFLLNLCADGQGCITRTVDKADREHTFKVDPVLRQYTLSLEAYLWKGNAKHSSAIVNASVASFPEVPMVDGFEVIAVSLREVRATWKTPIDADVRLHVCELESARKTCVSYVAHGTQLAYAISGLSPSTKYSIEASGAVTLDANTCLGPGVTREIATLTEAVCRYNEELKEVLRELSDNVRALALRQNNIEQNGKSDAIHSKCRAIEEKLRNLSETDLADCLQDIDKLLENYSRKKKQ